MKILIIDNTIDVDCWGSKDLCHLAQLAPNPTIYVRRAPQQDLPKSPSAYDAIIVSGSKTSAMADEPWIDQLLEFIKKAIALKKPFLGVCYGHQALVRAVGGNKSFVRKAATAEFGWTQINVTEPSSLLRGMPDSFYTFSAHFEEVAELPRGMRQLATSEDCSIQACQLEKLPIFGIQFHPEKSIAEAEKILLERKKKGTPAVLLNPTRSKELYNPQLGEALFKNFLQVLS
jgi:GMP synthase-like glutamine amidotransferase